MDLITSYCLSFHFRNLTDKGYISTQTLSKNWEDGPKHLLHNWIILDRHRAAEMPLWRIFLTKKIQTQGLSIADDCRLRLISLGSLRVGLPSTSKTRHEWDCKKRTWHRAALSDSSVLRTVLTGSEATRAKISSCFASRNGWKAQKRRMEWSMEVQIIVRNIFVIFNELQCSKTFFSRPNILPLLFPKG